MKERREFTQLILARIDSGKSSFALRAAGDNQPKSPRNTGALQKNASVLVAADNYTPSAVPVVKEALSLGRFGYHVAVLADDSLAAKIRRYTPAKSIHTIDSLFEDGAFCSVQAFVAASSPSIIAEIAAGFGIGLAAQTALWALWRGIDVHIDLSCADFGGIPCKNEKLRDMYGGYREKLLGLGVIHTPRGEVLSTLLPLLGRQMEPSKPAAPNASDVPKDIKKQSKRVFITEKDVLAYTGGTEWLLPASAAITAAGKDAAARRKIIFRKADALGGSKE